MRSNKHHNSILTCQHINTYYTAAVYLLIMIAEVTISNSIMDIILNSLDPKIDNYMVLQFRDPGRFNWSHWKSY